MPRQRSVLVLLIVPAVVSLAVTLLILNLNQPKEPETIVLPTHSSTSMIPARDTFPPQPTTDEAVATQEQGEADGNDGGEEVSEVPTVAETDSPVSGCENPIHVVDSGEVLGTIYEQYENIDFDELILINQLADPTFDPNLLYVGQELIIPVCGIPTPTPTSPPPDTAVPTRNIPSPIPTATNPPPGAIKVVIARVRNAGDITSEAVEIVNQGSPVNLQGWTLEGSEGRDEFTFPAQTLYSGGGVTIYTGVGEDTPIVLYWGLDEAVWEIGETISLFDDDGELQNEFVIEEE